MAGLTGNVNLIASGVQVGTKAPLISNDVLTILFHPVRTFHYLHHGHVLLH
jgi:hypothetical protein